jgi:hypothetical protein
MLLGTKALGTLWWSLLRVFATLPSGPGLSLLFTPAALRSRLSLLPPFVRAIVTLFTTRLWALRAGTLALCT